jgi:peroxiredoxin
MPRRVLAAGVFALAPVAASTAQTPASPAAASPSAAAKEPVRAVSHWNLAESTALAIDGYDPVAYFPEGGGKPLKGDPGVSLNYRGATYRFASARNKAAFESDPAKFEPAYGGWCAWAMLEGEKVEVDSKSFIVRDGRLFLFYNGFLSDTRSKWLKGTHAAQASGADAKWRALTGEAPRTPSSATLREKLEARKAEFAAKAPPELSERFEKGIADVAASGAPAAALKLGDAAPDFSLPDARGGTFTLSEALARGPVVITWYRGGWCPYCNLQLREYQQRLPEWTALGASLVAISPQTPDNSLSTAEKQELKFAVLSDAGNAVARRYGLVYTLPKDVGETLEKMVGLSAVNASASGELPLSATYVIDRTGKVVYAFVDADYRRRAEPSEILAALSALKPASAGVKP